MRKDQMDELPPADRKNLEWLLEAFSSVVSLEEIVSAYCQSGRNPDSAHQMLCRMQRRASKASSSTSEEELESINPSRRNPSNTSKEKHHIILKSKRHPTSVGTVSGVIRGDYDRHTPSTNGYWRPKPVKVDSADILVSELGDKKENTRSSESVHHEIEEFLFKMLGDGFNLEMGTIQEILSQCGYDMQQSMERLLNLPAPTVEKSDDLLNANPEEVLYRDSSPSVPSSTKELLPNAQREKRDLEKELLRSLFTAPERYNPEPVKMRSGKEARRIRPVGQAVKGPLRETLIDYQPIITRKDVIEKNDETNQDDYDTLRKSMAEYQTTMKEYYTAAAIAFANQDYERAQKLQEEGHFFMKKAQEADDKSAQMFTERDNEEEFIVDMRDFEPETVPRLLKVQLVNLSGISSLKCLKVIVGSNDRNAKNASRKRRILKFLEKENIQWTEEGDGWTIVIPVCEINPKKLSFARK